MFYNVSKFSFTLFLSLSLSLSLSVSREKINVYDVTFVCVVKLV